MNQTLPSLSAAELRVLGTLGESSVLSRIPIPCPSMPWWRDAIKKPAGIR